MLPELMDECKEAGHDLRVQGGRDEVWLEASIKKWLRSLCDHLRMYFPNMPLMSALYRLLNYKLVPSRTKRPEVYRLHGLEDLDVVLAHYGERKDGKPAVVDVDDVRDGWPRMKSHRFATRVQQSCHLDDRPQNMLIDTQSVLRGGLFLVSSDR